MQRFTIILVGMPLIAAAGWLPSSERDAKVRVECPAVKTGCDTWIDKRF